MSASALLKCCCAEQPASLLHLRHLNSITKGSISRSVSLIWVMQGGSNHIHHDYLSIVSNMYSQALIVTGLHRMEQHTLQGNDVLAMRFKSGQL